MHAIAGSCWGQSIAISGGTGALGGLVGSWAAASGASNVSLMSRSGAHNGCDSAQAAASSQISIMLCDVSLQEDTRTCLQRPEGVTSGAQHILHASKPLYPPLWLPEVVISRLQGQNLCAGRKSPGSLLCKAYQQLKYRLPSAGGITTDAMVKRQTTQTLRCTLAPKLDGALHLSEAAYGKPVLSCAFFSSVAALLGNAGQTSYAASNAALDGLAHSQQLQASQ